MKFTFNVNLGGTTITFEDTADNNVDFIEKSSFYMELPTECGMCQSTNLKVQHRVAQEFDFYSIKCKDCGGELKFGQAKEGRRLFPKNWNPAYDSNTAQPEAAPENYNPTPTPQVTAPSTNKPAAVPTASNPTPRAAAGSSLAERAAAIRNKVANNNVPNLRR